MIDKKKQKLKEVVFFFSSAPASCLVTHSLLGGGWWLLLLVCFFFLPCALRAGCTNLLCCSYLFGGEEILSLSFLPLILDEVGGWAGGNREFRRRAWWSSSTCFAFLLCWGAGGGGSLLKNDGRFVSFCLRRQGGVRHIKKVWSQNDGW